MNDGALPATMVQARLSKASRTERYVRQVRTLLRSRWVGGAVSLALLWALYRAADWRQVVQMLGGLDSRWMAAALLLFIPQTLVAAWRWQQLCWGTGVPVSFRTASFGLLKASAWNLIAPSKLGDFTRVDVLEQVEPATVWRLTKLILWERLGDLAALGLFAVWGWLARPAASVVLLAATVVTVGTLWFRIKKPLGRGLPLGAWLGSTLWLWALHLAQIGCFVAAAGVAVSPLMVLARVPVAIVAGLLPLTMMGVGTRDAAFVWLFSDIAPSSTMAAVGLLTTLRYIIPGFAGWCWMFSQSLGWYAEKDVVRLEAARSAVPGSTWPPLRFRRSASPRCHVPTHD